MNLDQVCIRWLLRRDMPEVMEIERAANGSQYTEDQLIEMMRQRNCIGMVVDFGEHVHGYMVYELHGDSVRLIHLAVHPESQRSGLGRTLLGKLIAKLNQQRRQAVVAVVPFKIVETCSFFKKQGFRCVHCNQDEVIMEYRLPVLENAGHGEPPRVNRLNDY